MRFLIDSDDTGFKIVDTARDNTVIESGLTFDEADSLWFDCEDLGDDVYGA